MSNSDDVVPLAADDPMIASIDQGTSSSRVIVFSVTTGEVVAQHQVPVTPVYPASGWIELDPDELYDTVVVCLNECAKQILNKGRRIESVAGIGVTNQRETTIVWSRVTGKALAPAIVWSDSRTTDLVKKFINLAPGKQANAFQRKTGLPMHSYFSAFKLCWLLENVPVVADASRDNTLMAGTVDTWLIWRLTNRRVHVTDVTNASRTMLFNLSTLNWDPVLCKFFGVHQNILPRVVSSSEVVGTVEDPACKLTGVKICGILGDQQASLVAQTWGTATANSFGPTVKVTYGTGAFMMWDIGTVPFYSDNGILTTVAFKMGSQKQAHYALEGAVSFAGATINWLRGKMELFTEYSELEELAQESYKKNKNNDADPCYLVPAFTGLFCPWWQENARAVIAGLTADVKRGDLLYAALRSSAFQTYDVLRTATLAQGDSSTTATLLRPRELVVDGGIVNSTVFMQSLADILDVIVRKHNNSALMTALGAAVAAAMAVGIDPNGLLLIRVHPKGTTVPNTFSSSLMPHSRQVLLTGWHAAVERSLGWIDSAYPAEPTDTLMNLMSKISQGGDENVAKNLEESNLDESSARGKQKEEVVLTATKLAMLLGVSVAFGLLIGRLNHPIT